MAVPGWGGRAELGFVSLRFRGGARDRLTEDDQVLGDAGVDDVHGAHGAAGVVKHPLLIEVNVALCADLRAELVDDVLDHRSRVVPVRCYRPLRKVVQLSRLEDVERLEPLLENVPRGRQDSEQNGKELEPAAEAG